MGYLPKSSVLQCELSSMYERGELKDKACPLIPSGNSSYTPCAIRIQDETRAVDPRGSVDRLSLAVGVLCPPCCANVPWATGK